MSSGQIDERGDEVIAYRVLVTGKVQGVFFRATMKRIADRYSITGWVRNLSDGRVEAFIEGKKKDLNSVIEWAKKGPPGAVVSDFSLSPETPRFLSNFEIRR